VPTARPAATGGLDCLSRLFETYTRLSNNLFLSLMVIASKNLLANVFSDRMHEAIKLKTANITEL
jgi:hypothetical protein